MEEVVSLPWRLPNVWPVWRDEAQLSASRAYDVDKITEERQPRRLIRFPPRSIVGLFI